jgi:hypothetical protein
MEVNIADLNAVVECAYKDLKMCMQIAGGGIFSVKPRTLPICILEMKIERQAHLDVHCP